MNGLEHPAHGDVVVRPASHPAFERAGGEDAHGHRALVDVGAPDALGVGLEQRGRRDEAEERAVDAVDVVARDGRSEARRELARVLRRRDAIEQIEQLAHERRLVPGRRHDPEGGIARPQERPQLGRGLIEHARQQRLAVRVGEPEEARRGWRCP